jgi:HPt (histidine-containing phosphotransfer) domain-containing protein
MDEQAPSRLEELRAELGAEVLLMIIPAFVTDTRTHLDQLRQAAIAGDFLELRRQAHSVSGAAANMGADALAGRATRMEHHGGTMAPLAIRMELAAMVAELAAWAEIHAWA